MPATGGECPKCAYSFEGEFAAWRESCPLRGRCPECGFGFAWGDLFGTTRAKGGGRARPSVRIPGWIGCTVSLLIVVVLVVVLVLLGMAGMDAMGEAGHTLYKKPGVNSARYALVSAA